MVLDVAIVLTSGLFWFVCIVFVSSTLLLDGFGLVLSMDVGVVCSSFCEFCYSIAVVLFADVV